ncbi:MAG: putative porin, partial [Pseudomonadota bacterium]
TAEKKVAAVKKTTDKLNWAEKIKFKGDLRLRRQWEKDDPAGESSQSRERYRYRLRLGATADVRDNVEVGLGFASGSEDPRSTNETFDDNFSTKDARLDYAYAQWTAFKNEQNQLNVIGGKFKRKEYLWVPTDLLWDSDINPEGFSTNFQNKNSLGTTFANLGFWIVDEFSSDSNDPDMYVAQLGQKFKSGNFYGNGAVTYYQFNEFDMVMGDDPNNFDDSSAHAWALGGEAGLSESLLGKRLAAIGEYVKSSLDDEDVGYSIGFKFGDKKVKDRGTWELKYIYADLEESAFPNIFPDSDRFGGLTGVTSNEIQFKYAVAKNITAVIDYYDSELDVPGEPTDDQQLLQTDIIFKF